MTKFIFRPQFLIQSVLNLQACDPQAELDSAIGNGEINKI